MTTPDTAGKDKPVHQESYEVERHETVERETVQIKNGQKKVDRERKLDEGLEDSFPASDPPTKTYPDRRGPAGDPSTKP